MISIKTNISAQKSIRLLDVASSDLQRSFTRLSSGLRINSASDDAAGLAVSSQLKNQGRLYSTATRNVSDAISSLNIVDGTLSDQSSILSRLSELAEQSANGSYSATQRRALNTEYQQLLREFGRLGDSTRFNHLDLLLGDRGNSPALVFQNGIDGSRNSTLRINSADSGSLSGVIDIRGQTNNQNYSTSMTFDELSASVNGNLYSFQVRDDNGRVRDMMLTYDNAAGITYYQRVSDTGGVGATTDAGAVVDSASDEWIIAGFTGHFADPTTGRLSANESWTFYFDNLATTATNEEFNLSGIYIRDGTNSVSDEYTAIDFTGVENASRARSALSYIKNRMDKVNKTRGEYGAMQSRLQSSLNVLSVTGINVNEASSRIMDVDVAGESAALVASQIKQQSAAAILSQANTQPSIALRLLNF